jgi:hypothetical protein
MRAVRAFGVMLGGPLLLLGSVLSATFVAVRSLGRGRIPGPAAAMVLALTSVYFFAIRPWHLRWGSRPGEESEPLPGDEVLAASGTLIQHAIDIDCAAEYAWPWIAQIGQDRAGFYSYEWLENLAGCEMVNADRIHPEWQDRQVGETIRLHPETGLKVTVFEPGRVLGIENWGNIVLREQGPDRCRLVVRGRAPTGAFALAYAVLLEIPHYIMERKMLLGIKRRAEGGPPGSRL